MTFTMLKTKVSALEMYSRDSRLTLPSDGKKYDFRKMIENRITNLGLIPDIIELGKAKYLINKNVYKTYTTIKADYLMEYNIEQNIFYVFSLVVRNNPDFANECICCSFFQKERVDFTKGTMSTKVLLIEKIMYMGKENEMCQTVYKNPVYVR